jgi:hypothetical protein
VNSRRHTIRRLLTQKKQRDIIFPAFLWHFGHVIAFLPTLTSFAVIVPFGHSNS